MQKNAYMWEMVQDTAKVCINHNSKLYVWSSESAVILVAMATGVFETLHRSRQRLTSNAKNNVKSIAKITYFGLLQRTSVDT